MREENACHKEHPPTLRAEVVFSFNNYGMKYSYDKKGRKTDYNTCKVDNNYFINQIVVLFITY